MPTQYFDQTAEHQLTVIATDYGIPGDPEFSQPATVIARTVLFNSAVSWPEFPEVVAQHGVLPIYLVTTNVLTNQNVMRYGIQITQLADDLCPTNKVIRLLEGISANNTISESWDYTFADGSSVEPGHLFEVAVMCEVDPAEGIRPTSNGGFTNASGRFVLCLAPGPRVPEFHCSIHCLDGSGNAAMDRQFGNAANFLKRTVDDGWLFDWIWGYELYGPYQYENNTGPPMPSPVTVSTPDQYPSYPLAVFAVTNSFQNDHITVWAHANPEAFGDGTGNGYVVWPQIAAVLSNKVDVLHLNPDIIRNWKRFVAVIGCVSYDLPENFRRPIAMSIGRACGIPYDRIYNVQSGARFPRALAVGTDRHIDIYTRPYNALTLYNRAMEYCILGYYPWISGYFQACREQIIYNPNLDSAVFRTHGDKRFYWSWCF